MELTLKEKSDSVKNRILLALFAVVGGVMSALLAQLGLLLMPIVAAPLAMIFIVESSKKRVFTIAVPVVLLATDVIFNGYYSFGALCAILVAVLIALSIKTGFLSKGECVMASVILVSAIYAFSFVMLGCYLAGELDFAVALDYYRTAIADAEAEWMLAAEQYILSTSDPELAEMLTPAVVSDIYDSYVNAIYSLIVVIIFAAVGFTCKLFGRLLGQRMDDRRPLQLWRFTLTPVYAYFYVTVYSLNVFIADGSVFSIVLSTLSNFFMFVFAYIGLLFVDAFFKMRSGGRGVNKALLVIVVVLLSTLAITLLSLAGIFAVVMLDRAKRDGFGDDGSLNV